MPGSCCGGGAHGVDCNLNPAKNRSTEFSLYNKIKWDEFSCLNESRDGDGKKVFKAWEDRLSDEGVETDIDGDMIFNIPFTGLVKLHGMIIVAPDGGTHPARVKIFHGNHRTFDEVGGDAIQEFELAHDSDGVIEYKLKTTKLSNVHHLVLYFPCSRDGGEVTRITYIGLRGSFTAVNRGAVTIFNYELTPNIKDHQCGIEGSPSQII